MRSSLAVILLVTASLASAADTPAPKQASPANPSNLGSDKNGNPLRKSKLTGHVSNYDEAKVGNYTLPDPLVLTNGRPVRDAATWTNIRRPEILKLYETEIYGHVPATA